MFLLFTWFTAKVWQRPCVPSRRIRFSSRVIAGWKDMFFYRVWSKSRLLSLTVAWCCRTDTFESDVLIIILHLNTTVSKTQASNLVVILSSVSDSFHRSRPRVAGFHSWIWKRRWKATKNCREKLRQIGDSACQKKNKTTQQRLSD